MLAAAAAAATSTPLSSAKQQQQQQQGISPQQKQAPGQQGMWKSTGALQQQQQTQQQFSTSLGPARGQQGQQQQQPLGLSHGSRISPSAPGMEDPRSPQRRRQSDPSGPDAGAVSGHCAHHGCASAGQVSLFDRMDECRVSRPARFLERRIQDC